MATIIKAIIIRKDKVHLLSSTQDRKVINTQKLPFVVREVFLSALGRLPPVRLQHVLNAPLVIKLFSAK